MKQNRKEIRSNRGYIATDRFETEIKIIRNLVKEERKMHSSFNLCMLDNFKCRNIFFQIKSYKRMVQMKDTLI